jgi:hypothetical protein
LEGDWEGGGYSVGSVGAPSGEFLRLWRGGGVFGGVLAQRGGGVFGGVLVGAEGGVGSLVGSWWGLCWCLGGRRGRRQGRKGGPLHFHWPTSRNGSYAVRRNFCALLLGGVHRSRTRNTRSAWDENKKDDFGVSGGKFELNLRVQILTPKLTRQYSHVVGRPYCMGNAVSTQPLKIPTRGRSVGTR